MTLIVSIAFCGSMLAQDVWNPLNLTSYWSDFDYHAFSFQTGFVAAIQIDGVDVGVETEGFEALEVAAFVGEGEAEVCRGNLMFLYPGYVEEYGDPYATLDGVAIYYTDPGDAVHFKMYDHQNEIMYTDYTITYLGDPIDVVTGQWYDQGWDDINNPIILNFTTPAPPAPDCKILVDADNDWSWDFEGDVEANGGYAEGYDVERPWTGVLPQCWTSQRLVELPITWPEDTICQVYRYFNTTEDGQYSLRMHFRSMLVLPELDESVDLGKVRLSMYVRQPYWRYKLKVGVVTDDYLDEEAFVPVAVVNNPDKNMTYFECDFSSVKDLVGPGRHIAFLAFGNSENDIYCTNYLDDIKLTYVECGLSAADMNYSENFEGDYGDLPTATGVEPECWEVIFEDVALTQTTKPQIYRGFNNTEGGEYSLRMMNRCIYAMPVLNNINVSDLSLSFDLRQPKSVYRLQVGVVDEEGNFTVVKTVKGSTSIDRKTVDFASLATMEVSPGNRIAFRNTLVPGTGMRTDYLDYSYNYIDNVVLSLVDQAKRDESDMYAMDANVDLEDIAVYPNPTTGNLYIDAIGIQKVECYNQMGQLVRVYDNVVNTIDLNNLSEGVYMLRITVPQGVTMRKVVKR